MNTRAWITSVVSLLLLIFVLEVALSTRQESPSWDEGDHIYSGYMNWKHGEYSLNPEHPPLVKLIATLPLLPLDLKVAPREGRYFKSEAYYGGRELLFRNDPKYGGQYSADTLLFRIHMTVLVFAFATALMLFFAGQQMFGSTAGLVALALYVFDPTILTNAPFVTTDSGAACGFFASVFTFYRFVKKPVWQRAILCGLCVGIALASKHSAVLLLPILLLLGAGELAGQWKAQRTAQWKQPRSFPTAAVRRILPGMAAIATIALFVLWSIYSFRYTMHPSGVAMAPLSEEVKALSPLMQKIILFCARFHLLPESYLFGFVDVQAVGDFMPTYFLGKLYAHGQWYYFPTILSLKWSIGILGLLALTLYALATGRIRRSREIFFLATPALFYLAVAMASPLNIGVRHVLPIFPFAFAILGAGAASLISSKRTWAVPVCALLLWHVTDSLRVFPNYMPYANTLWGGPSKTHLYFSDSATDWGQQLKWTKQWVDAHHVSECWFAYFPGPFLLPSDYGIPCKPLPTLDTMYEGDIDVPNIIHGPVLVSFADLNGFEFGTKVRNPYQSLFERQPVDIIANGIAVFYGDVSLPEASALKYQMHARSLLQKHPLDALAAARAAVALVPHGFDANIVLGDALAATGDKQGALAAYNVAASRIPEMEPTSQKQYRQEVQAKIDRLR